MRLLRRLKGTGWMLCGHLGRTCWPASPSDHPRPSPTFLGCRRGSCVEVEVISQIPLPGTPGLPMTVQRLDKAPGLCCPPPRLPDWLFCDHLPNKLRAPKHRPQLFFEEAPARVTCTWAPNRSGLFQVPLAPRPTPGLGSREGQQRGNGVNQGSTSGLRPGGWEGLHLK